MSGSLFSSKVTLCVCFSVTLTIFAISSICASTIVSSAVSCSEGSAPIGPCIDNSCPQNAVCEGKLICCSPTVRRLLASTSTNTTPISSVVNAPICVDRANNCPNLNNLCTIPRFSIQMLRSCRSTCRFCNITNIRQLAAELRIRNIVLGH